MSNLKIQQLGRTTRFTWQRRPWAPDKRWWHLLVTVFCAFVLFAGLRLIFNFAVYGNLYLDGSTLLAIPLFFYSPKWIKSHATRFVQHSFERQTLDWDGIRLHSKVWPGGAVADVPSRDVTQFYVSPDEELRCVVGPNGHQTLAEGPVSTLLQLERELEQRLKIQDQPVEGAAWESAVEAVQRPEGVQSQREGDRLLLTVPTKILTSDKLSFALMWNAMLWVPGVCSQSLGGVVMMYLLPHGWIGLYFIYRVWADRTNQLRIYVDRSLLRTACGPLPGVISPLHCKSSDIRQLYVVQKRHKHSKSNQVSFSYTLEALMQDDSRLALLSGIYSASLLRTLERELEEFLALENREQPKEFHGEAPANPTGCVVF